MTVKYILLATPHPGSLIRNKPVALRIGSFYEMRDAVCERFHLTKVPTYQSICSPVFSSISWDYWISKLEEKV